MLKTLKRYIKVEQKDRANVIGHYQNIRRNDPAEAEAIFSYVDNHMRVIDQRLTQALDMLVRVPKHEKKIRQHIRKQSKMIRGINCAYVNNLFLKSQMIRSIR